jgi:TetR/AcrR family transcriptional regulator, acrAB operon repressor
MYVIGETIMRRTKEEAAITRQNILKAALELFSEKGYATTTLAEIAQSADVTRGAIYWHFKDKADLFNSLASEVSLRREVVIQQAIAHGGTFTQTFHRILTQLLRDVEEHPDVQAVMKLSLFQSAGLPELEESHALRLEANRAMINNMATFLQQGIESGAVRAEIDPHDAARTALALHQGLAMLWLYDPTAFSLAKRASALADLYIQGIAAG